MNARPYDEIAALFRSQYLEMVRVSYLLTSDRELAEDLVQEAFVRVWQRWGRIRRGESVVFYLRSAVVNLSRDSLRRRLIERRHRAVEEGTPPASPDSQIDLARALRRLPSGKRACVVLRYYVDLSEEETARVLGVTVGTVKSQTFKALRQLQETLAPGDPFSSQRASEGGER